jgi:hypothetical protein
MLLELFGLAGSLLLFVGLCFTWNWLSSISLHSCTEVYADNNIEEDTRKGSYHFSQGTSIIAYWNAYGLEFKETLGFSYCNICCCSIFKTFSII